MGAQKRLIRTICLAAVIASSAANSAFAHETETQEGVASFYSDRFQGAPTASGEPFDQQALTAAHPSLPFGTKVLVTRPDTGQEVEVLINDRGPFIQGRIIDLSKRAAAKLGMIRRGTAPVMVTLLD
ncbi:septal ring lytic transglycosylase RlpA family protein [Halomonas sp. FeN2]|jgi:rare lipoprotein A|uniref:Endolytic peptidoglycan transglycosylase RlpA n=1 Tax=Vreelandella neptunia TaxID=115551 RepID=A0ABZ0YNI9_9GAMM|nr:MULTISPECIES: septal ring lytic transglycosylase RlpA family protein [Halomonas]TDV92734.1 rare lipoprotein A [Halomonas alkaliantarctica]MBF59626.1 septal ring lytic transglycosylase RlpA family lipoprotein [Halomonas sp.]MBL1267098.1 septal ring lytic transglycosylase RlpA family protein [Halomonas sp.]MDN3558741.1 septal ring lytic transglycosylase RlpA family protein [Halomonas neptunia]UBR48881.1 septal ring lytic transglycosylase RlpA family protein [Halomonas sp. FeN2]|tara:strand:+ start:1041 stop:1421 length:381 start_codon:yes stop_codon:yes gene_type:complete